MKTRWLLLLALWLTAALALADAVQERRIGMKFQRGVPHVSFSATEMVDASVRKKLDSGLPQRLVVQHFAYVPGRNAPVAAAGHSCRVVYDLWQNAYRVQYSAVGQSEQALNLRTQQEVIDRCLIMREVPLGKARDFPSGRRFHVASLIELNPLSKQTVARIRRWLARPGGGDSIEGNSFFGSFVSLFVNHRIGSAERVLRVRSQTFKVR